MQILIIGDVMLDIYLQGEISRISPEAPVPVIKNATKSFSAGGAANVAANLANIGADICLYGIIGKDEDGRQLMNVLKEANVNFKSNITADLPTITKLRIIGNRHHLARLDTEYSYEKEADSLFEKVKSETPEILILSDYNKGSIVQSESIIQHFKNKGVKVLVDPKKAFSEYKGAWIIKPNKNEFIRHLGFFSNHEELVEKAQNAIKLYDIQQMLVTLGSEGMMYITKDTFIFFPAQTQQVADITGAGDTVLTGLVYGIIQGFPIQKSILLAKTLAEISVTKMGTYVINKNDLQKALGEVS
ncbi:MAG: PfkB family carbohydrate kinase [Chitinophagales bacterium]|nr:PfkB family carbohydrate kinase [Chitinophagales bacterium]